MRLVYVTKRAGCYSSLSNTHSEFDEDVANMYRYPTPGWLLPFCENCGWVTIESAREDYGLRVVPGVHFAK